MASYTNLLYHLVFSTKHRERLLSPSLCTDLHPYMGGIVRNHRGIALEIGGMQDHVHLIVKLTPDMCVYKMVQLIKSNSSKWINEQRRLERRFEWQTKYGAFTVSESELMAVRMYVRNQEEHHRHVSFQEEFRRLLVQHGIPIDERYMWD